MERDPVTETFAYLLRRSRHVAFVLIVGALLLPTAAQAQLAITEMMSSALKTNGMIISTNNSDFWELTNFGTNTVSTLGYSFSDNKNGERPLPFVIMQPGESVVFVRDNITKTEEQFRDWWGACVSSNVQIRFFKNPGFSSNGDGIRVFDPFGELVDSVDFGPARRGVSFVNDTISGAFGQFSVLGQGGACQAENAADIGSPGRTTDPIPLRILQQPTNVTACLGASATFSVSAVGMPRPRYQWFYNDVLILGANEASFTVPDVTPGIAGQFRVVITNGLTSLQSSNATLAVDANPAAPTFVVPPLDTRVVTNHTARFSVSVCASPAATYQWFSNGVPVAGGTGRTLLVPNCTLAMSGDEYCVRVQNANGTNMACARLYVTTKPDLRITEVQAYPVTGCGDEHHDWFEVTNFGTNAVDMLGYRFSDEFTLAGSVTVTQSVVVQPHESVVFAKNPTPDIFIKWWGANQLPPGLKVYSYSGFSLFKGGDTLYLWNDLAELPEENIDGISFATNFLGVSQFFDAADCFFGCDSVLGQAGAFSSAQCGDIGSPGYTATPSNQPPVMVLQPTNLTVNVGGSAQFFSRVSGSPALTYQWRRNGANVINDGRISGATGEVLTISNVIAGDAGLYTVRVANPFGFTVSSNAVLAISLVDHFSWAPVPSPQSTLRPFAVTVEARDSLNRIVTNFNGTVSLSASNTATGTALAVLPAVSGAFVAGVWNGSVSVPQLASNVVLRAVDESGNLGVSAPFAVEQFAGFHVQPTNQNVLPGTNVTLIASAVGTGPMRYQWRLEGTNIPGATNASYSFTNASLANHGNYSVLATDDITSLMSSNAFVFVLIRPGFVQQPQPQTVVQGQNATISVVVTGAPPLWFRWIRAGAPFLTNAVPMLTLTNCQASVSLRVAVTNMATGLGGLNSSNVLLTVLADGDGDALPDVWESAYFGSTTNALATEDTDSDGLSNREEYLARTDPTSALSVLKLTYSATNRAQLYFTAQTNLSYTVQWLTNLAVPVWSNLTSITAQPTMRTVLVNTVDAPPGAEHYFRVVTPLVP